VRTVCFSICSQSIIEGLFLRELQSALIAIHKRNLTHFDTPSQTVVGQHARSTFDLLARQAFIVCQGFLDGYRGTPALLTPLLFDWFYQVAAVTIILLQDSYNEELAEGKDVIVEALKQISERWAVAGER
jgi:hypothetical protein